MNFVPFKSVGIFSLNEKVDQYLIGNSFICDDTPDQTDWITYKSSSLGLSLYVDVLTNQIESISCYSKCLYKGRNLIGVSLDDLIYITNEAPDGLPDVLDFEEDNIPQHVYEFDDIGLQVWTKNNIVVTVIASDL